MEELARSREPDDLDKEAFGLYEAFRPEIPDGESGWGAKGKLNLNKVPGVG